MPVTVNQVSNQYKQAIEQLRAISEDPGANQEQRRSAQEAIDDLYLQLGANAIQRIDGRNALLTALITELTAVRDSVELNPIGKMIDELTELISIGRSLHNDAKRDMANEDDGALVALG